MLIHAGCRLLADDKVVLLETSDGWLAAPGAPQLRLWPDALTHLDQDPARLVRVLGRQEKRFLPLAGQSRGPLPLRAVYILAPRGSEQGNLEGLRPAAALFHLLDQRLGATMRTRAHLADDTRRLRLLAEGLPTRLVHRSNRLQDLPGTVDAVLADFRRQLLRDSSFVP
jgi:hypothetical protein